MCDHCGCRQITPIGRLMSEHERLLDLAGDTRRALRRADEPAARASFAELLALLWPHVRSEEIGLFAALREAGEFVGHVDGLETEHRQLRTAVATADASADGAEWARRVTGILDELREHIHVEEYGLFPAALATLGGTRWDAMVEMVDAQTREVA